MKAFHSMLISIQDRMDRAESTPFRQEKEAFFCVENAQQNQFEATKLINELQKVCEVIVQVAKEVLHAILQKLRRHLPSHVVPDVLQKHVLAIAINLNSALMKLEYWVNHSTVRVATPPSCPK